MLLALNNTTSNPYEVQKQNALSTAVNEYQNLKLTIKLYNTTITYALQIIPTPQWEGSARINPKLEILSSKYLLNEWVMTKTEVTLRC
jgi:hypothetical protein